jgi:chromosome segregation ATPase
MVKTASDTTKSAPSQKKQIKKQAKQEAKLQARIKQARQDAQKTEKKVARVQSKLADAQAHIHFLEERLSQLQSSRQFLNGTPAVSGNNQQAELPALDALVTEAEAPATQEEAIEELHQESLPPAEGRADVPAENQEPSSESAEAVNDEQSADSTPAEEKPGKTSDTTTAGEQ